MKNHAYTRIEFMGLPGSGKTSLCNELTRFFKKNKSILTSDLALNLSIKRRNSGRLKNIFKRLPYALQEPILGMTTALPEFHLFASDYIGLWHLVFEVLDRRSYSTEHRQLVTYAFIQQSVQYQLLKQYMQPEECVLIEEGFGQRGFTLFGYLQESFCKAGDEKRYVAAIPCPDILIWLMADLENVLSRMEKRKSIPLLLEKMPPDEIRAQLLSGAKCLERIADFMEQNGVKVFRVSNNDGEFKKAFDCVSHPLMEIV